MDLGLEGRVAAVAAASSGLGRAIAAGLSAEGARVAICSRDEERVRSTAEQISAQTGQPVLPVVADVSTASDATRFVEEAVREWGRLDILVTNAGGPAPGTFDELTDEQWCSAFDLTLMSVTRLIRAALPHMRANRWGRIINLSSTSVKAPIPGLMLSNAMRSAVIGLAKTLSNEVAKDGITVNNILPGRLNTERTRALDTDTARRRGITPEEARNEWLRQIPMGRYGEPTELADLVLFLASERASYITGTSIQVDGGLLPTMT